MPSFSRATAAMRGIFAACAISMSEGISVFALVLRKTRILESATSRGLDDGQERPRKQKRRRGARPAAFDLRTGKKLEPGVLYSLSLLAGTWWPLPITSPWYSGSQ